MTVNLSGLIMDVGAAIRRPRSTTFLIRRNPMRKGDVIPPGDQWLPLHTPSKDGHRIDYLPQLSYLSVLGNILYQIPLDKE